MPAKFVGTKEVAEFLGISEQCVRLWAKKGKIPSIRLARKVIRFDLDKVHDHLMRSNRQVVAAV
jgi:excisionase family DNA binding protein